MRVTVRDSGLRCCTCVTYFERKLTSLLVDAILTSVRFPGVTRNRFFFFSFFPRVSFQCRLISDIRTAPVCNITRVICVNVETPKKKYCTAHWQERVALLLRLLQSYPGKAIRISRKGSLKYLHFWLNNNNNKQQQQKQTNKRNIRPSPVDVQRWNIEELLLLLAAVVLLNVLLSSDVGLTY